MVVRHHDAGQTVFLLSAIKSGVARANRTLKNVKSAWVWNQEVTVDDDGNIAEYRVHMKVTFVLED